MAEKKKPNVLLIMADDVGWFDVGAYNRGIMSGPTPNIDRIAHEGVLLTDCYAQASCTAGRAALITGQLPTRTGLTTVGLPGAPQGLHPEDPTLAELLKPEGYMTAQIGKNHLHLNADEGPEQADYPKDLPVFQNFFKLRGSDDSPRREFFYYGGT
jgi:arylsulfatase A-like enzyme